MHDASGPPPADELHRECRELRLEVDRLRQSRRVLMTLLAREMQMRQETVNRLEAENRRLRRRAANEAARRRMTGGRAQIRPEV